MTIKTLEANIHKIGKARSDLYHLQDRILTEFEMHPFLAEASKALDEARTHLRRFHEIESARYQTAKELI